MNPSQLQQWIRRPELLDRNSLYELRNLLARYPYFQTLRLLYLKNLYLLHDSSFGSELRKSVIYVPDRRRLFYLIEGEHRLTPPIDSEQSEAPTDVPQEGVDRTLALIEAFLAQSDEAIQEDELPLTDYVTDYTAYLLRESDEPSSGLPLPQLRRQDLIDNFIEQESPTRSMDTPTEHSTDEATATSEVEEDFYFTETLAKIYIKQQKYEKALEIIKRLSLKTPRKNAYFADQIRFLEKLIINANSK